MSQNLLLCFRNPTTNTAAPPAPASSSGGGAKTAKKNANSCSQTVKLFTVNLVSRTVEVHFESTTHGAPLKNFEKTWTQSRRAPPHRTRSTPGLSAIIAMRQVQGLGISAQRLSQCEFRIQAIVLTSRPMALPPACFALIEQPEHNTLSSPTSHAKSGRRPPRPSPMHLYQTDPARAGAFAALPLPVSPPPTSPRAHRGDISHPLPTQATSSHPSSAFR